jgi:CHASE2 domain-containing sensor protein
VEAPAWTERAFAFLLSLLCLVLGLRLEFRSLMLSGIGIAAGVVVLGYVLFLFDIFFACRLPVILSLGIVILLGGARFLAGAEGK